jgi:hypothetical protein
MPGSRYGRWLMVLLLLIVVLSLVMTMPGMGLR